MATIALYANKINQMPGLIKDVKISVTDYKTELSELKKKTLTINKSICDLDEVISSIQTSTQLQDDKIDSLDTFCQESEEFISDVIRIDSDAADIIRERKDDFYDKYAYLKPECEKSGWEKFCDGCQKVGEWCKENWKSIVKIVVAVVVIVVLAIATVYTGGTLAVILAGALWGAVAGGLIGGISGGITSARNGGTFFEGFADGAFSGVISGAISGAAFAGLGVAGSALGRFLGGACKAAKYADKAITALKYTSKISGVISTGMGAFDSLALVAGFFNPDNPLTAINEKLHSNAFYNTFQIGVSIAAVFSASAYTSAQRRMQQGSRTCFIAGTMILTLAGLVAIENIKAGDRVVATNPYTFETEEKMVVETYIRQTPHLVHLTIGSELITTTAEHPFYVKEQGFVKAGDLEIGDLLIGSKGENYTVENVHTEFVKNKETVYNFQVEDFHTYHVGVLGLLVHNANYPKSDGDIEVEGNESGGEKYTSPAGGGGITATIDANGKTVNFGHGGRHLEGTGLDVNKVNQALANKVSKLKLSQGEFFKGQIEVDGITIEFTSYGLSDNTINIGTYYPICN